MSVEDLKNRLRGEAEKVDEGRFRVDAQRALAKLRDFRLADPHHYVLELLRAAVLSGAPAVEVQVDADDLQLSFDAPPLPPAVLRDLLGHALSAGTDAVGARARLLALGVAGALALKPAWVRVESGGNRLEVKPPDDVAFAAVEAPPGRLSIHVRERIGLATLRDAVFGPVEAKVIREWAPHFPVPLTLNGERVDRPVQVASDLGVRDATQDGVRLVVGVPFEPWKRSQIAFDVLGVTVVRRPQPLAFLQVDAWARDDALKRNASGSDIVEGDSRYEAILRRIEKTAEFLVEELCEATQRPNGDAARTLLQALAVRSAREGGFAAVPPRIRTLVQSAAILPGPAGEWLAMNDFIREGQAGRPIRYSRFPHPEGSYARPVLLLDGTHPELLSLLPSKPSQDIEREVEANLKARRYRARWDRQPVEPLELPDEPYVAQGSFGNPAVRGKVGLTSAVERPTVRLLCQGKVVQTTEVPELSPWRLKATVDLKRLLKEEEWLSLPIPLPDVAKSRIHAAAMDAIEQALGMAAEPSEELRAHARDAIGAAVRHGGLSAVDRLPEVLRDVAVFPLVGGGWLSIGELAKLDACRYVSGPRKYPPLRGEKVVILDDRQREIVRRLVSHLQMQFYGNQLAAEEEVRARMAGPRSYPVILPKICAQVPIREEGIEGELGIPWENRAGLQLRLLRDGLVLGEAPQTARYEVAVASVDAPGLTPNHEWSGAQHDEVFDRVLAAVRAAERSVCGALLEELDGRVLDQLPAGGARYLRAFLRKELHGAARAPVKMDALQQRAFAARLFRGLSGPLSLEELSKSAAVTGKVLWHEGPPTYVPADLPIVGSEEAARFAAEVLGVPAQDGSAAIERARRVAEFRSRSQFTGSLPKALSLRAGVSSDRLRGEVAFDPAAQRECVASILLGGRLLQERRVPSALKLRAILALEDGSVDPGDADAANELAARAFVVAEVEIVRAALRNPNDPTCREALLLAVGGKLDKHLEPDEVQALLSAPLFRTTEEKSCSAAELDAQGAVQYVTEGLSGAPRSGHRVVVAADPLVRIALARWLRSSEDVTESLRTELAVRARRSALPPVEEIRLRSALVRKAVKRPGIEGEIGLAPHASAATVDVYVERRLLCTISTDLLPCGVAAAIEAPALLPTPDYAGVARDDAFRRAMKGLADEVGFVAAAAFDRWESAPGEHAAIAPSLAQVALWMAQHGGGQDPVSRLPLFEKTDGGALSLREILDEQKAYKRVRISPLTVAPLEGARWVLHARAGERDAFEHLGVCCDDATAELREAEDVRARPRVEDLTIADRAWREDVAGPGMEGQVAIDEEPSGKLSLELLKERRVLERVEVDHPVGGVARVNCDALEPTRGWTRAGRTKAFRDARAAVEDALERLVARRVGATEPLPAVSLVAAALNWRLGRAGPLGEALPRVAAFEALGGGRVTLGRVLEEHAARRSIAVAARGLTADPEHLVLASSPENFALLAAMKFEREDVSAVLRRRRNLDAERNARRLKELRFARDALVRREVQAAGFRGELALPLEPEAEPAVVLARQGIAVDKLPEPERRVAGVVDHPSLPVDSEWRSAQLPPGMRREIEGEIDALFSDLAASAERLPSRRLEIAASYALRYLAHAGVRSPQELDGLRDTGAALASAPLFQTADGRRVALRTVAEQAVHPDGVPVVRARLFGMDLGDELVLVASSSEADWISRLEAVLGARHVAWIEDVAAWTERRAEAEPEADTPLARGLSRLRKELRLLRAEAFGRVGGKELEEIRLRRSKGKIPVWYDVKRAVATLDPEHPAVREALERAAERPDRIYALLAAVYGAVNRALEEVTDEDEAKVAGALLGHLASNPNLLEPAPAPPPRSQ